MERDLLGIGEVSRASGLTVSALRFYDGAGLLVPAYVDPQSGYRRYRDEQVRTARVLANLRRVGMPLADVARVLDAPTATAAAGLLDQHLRRLEAGLADARQVLSRVRHLLDVQENPMTTTVTVTVAAADLAAALDRVRYAASSDPDLPALCGVLVELGDGAVRLVATDRYRLAVAEAGGPVAEPAASVLVGAAFVDRVRRSLDGAATVELAAGGDALTVTVDGAAEATPALGLDFPAYRSLLPGPRQHRVPLDVAELRSALADVPGTVARLAIDADRVLVGAASGDAMELGVDPAFLLEALAAGGSRQLVLELDGPVAPLAIRPAAPDGSLALLMPVRLDA